MEHERIHEGRTCTDWNNQLVEPILLKTEMRILIDLKRGNSSLNLSLMIHSSGPKYVILVSDESPTERKKAECTSENESSLQERDMYGISMQQKHFHLNSLKSTPQLQRALVWSSGISFLDNFPWFSFSCHWYCFRNFLIQIQWKPLSPPISLMYCSACLTPIVIGTRFWSLSWWAVVSQGNSY